MKMTIKEILAKIILKRKIITIWFIRFFLVVAILGSVYELNWMALFVGLLALLLSFSPEFLKHRYRIELPNFLQIFVILFIFTSLFLGEVRSFYIRYWWWDSLLHLLSGLALGLVGFLIVYVFNKIGKFRGSPIILSMFAFCFALALGALWEIFEFFMDQLLNLDMQKSRYLCGLEAIGYCDTRLGLVDTMIDLILDSIGALVASIGGYLYLAKSTPSFFDKIIKEFELKNKHLFKKR